MKTLRDYDGAEGIKKFAEVEPYLVEIIKDKNINIAELTKYQLGVKALELHPDACDAIIKIFEGSPNSPQGRVAAISTVLVDILTDKDMIDFFILSGKITESK